MLFACESDKHPDAVVAYNVAGDNDDDECPLCRALEQLEAMDFCEKTDDQCTD